MLNAKRPPYALTVGAIVENKNKILLVKHNYGVTKGKWDFVRGYVEVNESIEEAVVREVFEETSIKSVPSRIIGVRNQVKRLEDGSRNNDLLIIWLMNYISGEPKADLKEIEETRFIEIDTILNMDNVGPWTKEIIKSMYKNNGLIASEYKVHSLPKNIEYWKHFS